MKTLSAILLGVLIMILILGRYSRNREARDEALQFKGQFENQSSNSRPSSKTSFANKRRESDLDSSLLTRSYWDESFSTNPIWFKFLPTSTQNGSEFSSQISVGVPTSGRLFLKGSLSTE
jgi:hypothetical protein